MLDQVGVTVVSGIGERLVAALLAIVEELHVGGRIRQVLDPPDDLERPVAAHEDVHAAVLQALKHLRDRRRATHLAEPALGQPDDPEVALLLDAAPDHQLVALLEYVQGDHLGGQQYQPQREQREAVRQLTHRP